MKKTAKISSLIISVFALAGIGLLSGVGTGNIEWTKRSFSPGRIIMLLREQSPPDTIATFSPKGGYDDDCIEGRITKKNRDGVLSNKGDEISDAIFLTLRLLCNPRINPQKKLSFKILPSQNALVLEMPPVYHAQKDIVSSKPVVSTLITFHDGNFLASQIG